MKNPLSAALAKKGFDSGYARGFSIGITGVTHRKQRVRIEGVGVGFDLSPFFILCGGRHLPALHFTNHTLETAVSRVLNGCFL